MKKTLLIAAIALTATSLFAQKKTTSSATITFDATTPADAFPKAENKTSVAAIDTKKGTVAFESQIKGFNFSNPTMQQHFNSPRWLDSEQFPTATFTGKITNLADVKFDKNGTYTANVEGDLSIHGVTNPVKTTATIVVGKDGIATSSKFEIKLDAYKLSNAGGKLDNNTKITVAADFK
ncbi:YceI family protein [Ferruginibacter yonginensis]|uniref:YceI family protein n=1 Tax=Ferruginibacter yonginensis TaxID=1310416 RepID=A0ABV8QUH6_9BACT